MTDEEVYKRMGDMDDIRCGKLLSCRNLISSTHCRLDSAPCIGDECPIKEQMIMEGDEQN